MIDIRVVAEGPLFERLEAAEALRLGTAYVSAMHLYLVTPTGEWNGGLKDGPKPGVWYFKITIGFMATKDQHERIRLLAERILDATLTFLDLLDGGDPRRLEVADLEEVWPKATR